MNLLKSLWRKIFLLARATLQDLFVEDGIPGPGGAADETETIRAGLAQFQQRLDELQPGLAILTGRVKRAEVEQGQVLSALENLDQAIDEAIRADQEDQARTLLGQRKALQAHADDLIRRRSELDGMAREMKADIDGLRLHLNEARRQADELAAREQSAAALEQLAQLRRELNRDLIRLQEDFDRRDERAAQIEDRAAALQELERRKR